MDKNAIITLKMKGRSNREVARATGTHRKTVARYWDEYRGLAEGLQPGGDNRMAQERMASPPRYDSTGRKPKKYTAEIDAAIDAILDGEAEKARELGDGNKQKLTVRQIHWLLAQAGHDIGLTTVTMRVREKRGKASEAFIRQEYDFGDRVEYDFGEVRLVVGGVAGRYHLAVFGSPRGKFRWAYLYDNQRKEAFQDSHVRFFEMVGGAYREVCYDNMRNVVTRFIGRSGKDLDADLVAMSTYYGFSINVTNCFRGNEKGYVESSVRAVRNGVFAARWRFASVEEAEAHLEAELARMNEGSLIWEEMGHLLPWRPPLDLSRLTEQTVDKYSFVRVENNFYSVPEYLVGRAVTVRRYAREVAVYSGMSEVCRHRRLGGCGGMSVNIMHYLDTLAKKPMAVRNSKALRSEAGLKAVFDARYAGRPREFIETIRANRDRPLDEIERVLLEGGGGPPPGRGESIGANVAAHALAHLRQMGDFLVRGCVGDGD